MKTLTNTLAEAISRHSHEILFQYFTKEHLDHKNLLTQQEWEDFTERFQSNFAEESSEIARECFESYLNERLARN